MAAGSTKSSGVLWIRRSGRFESLLASQLLHVAGPHADRLELERDIDEDEFRADVRGQLELDLASQLPASPVRSAIAIER